MKDLNTLYSIHVNMQYITSPKNRISYDDLVRLPDFRRLYTIAIEKAGLWKRLEALDGQGSLSQPLRILDMGGGVGTLGTLLETEFGPFVEYTNVDTDITALGKSPGRRAHGSYTNLPELLGEEEFDYVFCLNLEDRTRLSQYTIDNMRRGGQGDGFFGTDLVSMTADAAYASRQLEGYLVLLNAALVVAQGGMFIRGGIIPKDALKGTKDELAKVGFQTSEDEQLPLDMKTSRLWVRYDLQFIGGKLAPSQLEKAAQTYMQNFRLATFSKKRNEDKGKILDKINEVSSQLSEL